MKPILFTTLSLLLMLITSCQSEHTEKPSSSQPQQNKAQTAIGFQEIKEKVLQPQCINCHSDRHLAYENYEIVRLAAKEILQRIETSDPREQMPKDTPRLGPEMIALVREWVEAGAPEFGTPSKDEPTPVQPDFISFAEVQEKIFKPRCNGCHTHFENYEVVRGQVGSIFSLVMKDQMPFPRRKGQKTDPLSSEQKKLLSDWVNQGAPNDRAETEEPKPLPLEPNWLSLRNKVFGPKCILCHNSYGSRAPTAMGTHVELRQWALNSPLLFNSEKPNKSHFVGSMLGRVDKENDEFFFDPMPFNNPADDVQTDLPSVTTEELKVIEEWIRRGLPYDSSDRPPGGFPEATK